MRILLEQTKNLKILKTLAWKNKILNTTYAQQGLLRYVGLNASSLVIGNVQFISFKRFWAVCTRPGRRFTPFARAWPNVVVTENITKQSSQRLNNSFITDSTSNLQNQH